MRIIDAETGELDTIDPAAAAATGADSDNDTSTTVDDDPLAAMDAGIAAASDAEPAAAEPVKDAATDPAAQPEVDKATEAKPDESAKPDAAKPDADTEAEITALGLKEKSAARFRELTAEVKALAPIKQQLEQAGIKDVAELPRLVKDATDGRDLVKMVQDTGADPDQFGKTLDYLSLIGAASKGDMKAAEQAFDVLQGEVAALAKALGREVPGMFDPLAEHADLRDAIEAGDMTRKHAMEVAHARTQQQAAAQHQQQTQTQQRQQQEREQAQQQATQQGITGLQAWEQRAAATNPNYAAIRPALSARVAEIRKTHPPGEWVAQTAIAYAELVTSAAPAAPAAPRPGPIRPSGPGPTMAPATFDSIEAAMDFGITQASR
jgi:hypothetical protein